MSYAFNCVKCGVEVGHNERSFLLPNSIDKICYDCELELYKVIQKWLDKKEKSGGGKV